MQAEKRRKITRRHRDELVRRIEELRAALNVIEGGLACDYEDITECPNYQSLVAYSLSKRWRSFHDPFHGLDPATARSHGG